MKKKVVLHVSLIVMFILFIGCTKAKYSSGNSIKKNPKLPVGLSTESLQYTTQKGLKQTEPKTESERYEQAIDAIKEKCYPQAIGILADLGDYKDARSLSDQLRYLINGSYISNGMWSVGAITHDRGVKVAYYDSKIRDKQYDVKAWNNIKAVSMSGGDSIEGLTAEGRIITTSKITKESLLSSTVGSTNAMANVAESISSWSNVKSFQTFYPQSAVALTNDGYVYAAYPSYQDGTVKLQGWDDIVAVADGRGYAAGLKKDGTVICNVYSYSGKVDTSQWKDIVAISAGTSLIGLKEDGTVVSTGLNKWGEGLVTEWTDIIAISTSNTYTLGLKRDGTVVTAGRYEFGQNNVKGWKDIAAISAGTYFSIGLKTDGTIVLAGDCRRSGVETPDVSEMKDLYVPQISINK